MKNMTSILTAASVLALTLIQTTTAFAATSDASCDPAARAYLHAIKKNKKLHAEFVKQVKALVDENALKSQELYDCSTVHVLSIQHGASMREGYTSERETFIVAHTFMASTHGMLDDQSLLATVSLTSGSQDGGENVEAPSKPDVRFVELK